MFILLPLFQHEGRTSKWLGTPRNDPMNVTCLLWERRVSGPETRKPKHNPYWPEGRNWSNATCVKLYTTQLLQRWRSLCRHGLVLAPKMCRQLWLVDSDHMITWYLERQKNTGTCLHCVWCFNQTRIIHVVCRPHHKLVCKHVSFSWFAATIKYNLPQHISPTNTPSLRPPWGLSLIELFNIVSLVQSHHKAVWMYRGGLVTLSLGLWWDISNERNRSLNRKMIGLAKQSAAK